MAQEATALWAFWMLVISGIMATITALGTILLYKQIVLTREAVEDTGKATEAMLDANKIAKEIGLAQIRAYMSVKAKSLTFDTDTGFNIELEIRNSGQSPARSLDIISNAKLEADDMLQSYDMGTHLSPMGDFAGQISLPKFIKFKINDEHKPVFRNKTAVIYIKVTCIYFDIFNNRVDNETFRFICGDCMRGTPDPVIGPMPDFMVRNIEKFEKDQKD